MSENSLPITVAALRRGWREEIAKYDDMIVWIESGGTINPVQQDAQHATQAWLKEIQQWRGKLEELLIKFPGEG